MTVTVFKSQQKHSYQSLLCDSDSVIIKILDVRDITNGKHADTKAYLSNDQY